jgi:hypothetical protein
MKPSLTAKQREYGVLLFQHEPPAIPVHKICFFSRIHVVGFVTLSDDAHKTTAVHVRPRIFFEMSPV